MSLLSLIKASQCGDKEALLKIITKFQPSIKKFSAFLNYYGAETDLVIGLIESTQKLQLSKLNFISEAVLVQYVYNCIRNNYIQLSKKHKLQFNNLEYEAQYVTLSYCHNLEDKLYLEAILNILTEIQRKVLLYYYVYDISDIEIAIKFNISRQAVNKTRRKALEHLRKLA